MTISNQVTKTTVQCNGAQTTFTYDFWLPFGSTFALYQTTSAGIITKIAAAQFSITGIGSMDGGNFTYPTSGSPIAAGDVLTLVRLGPYSQLTDFGDQGNYNPSVLEDALDTIVGQTQDLNDRASLAIHAPITEGLDMILPAAAVRANQYLAFDNNGVPRAVPGAGGIVSSNQQDFYLFAAGSPTVNQRLFQGAFTRSITFPANMAGSVAIAAVAATADTVCTIIFSGNPIGTITWSAGSTTGVFACSAFTTASGSLLVVQYQGTTDATLADLSITLSGVG